MPGRKYDVRTIEVRDLDDVDRLGELLPDAPVDALGQLLDAYAKRVDAIAARVDALDGAAAGKKRQATSH